MLPEYFLQKTWENAAVLFPNAVRISRMKGTAERQALPPAFMREEGHAVAGGAPRRSGGESLLSHGFAVPAPPEGKPRAHRTVLAPRIYEGGGPRSGRGSLSAAAGTALSVTLRVPALPKGEPRALRTVLAPRIYEGGGPRSGRGSPPAAAGKASSVTASPCQLPQRGSRGSFAPFLPPAFMRGESPRRSGGNPLSHGFACRLSRRESQGAVVVPRSHSTGGFPRQCAHSLGMTGNRESAWNDRFPADCFRTARPPTSRSPGLAFSGGLWYNAECIFLI